MKTQNNCPSCGAAIVDEKCPYCGALFYDFAAIEMDKPFYVKFKSGSRVYRVRAIMDSINIRHDSDNGYVYADDIRFYARSQPNSHLTLELTIIPDDSILGIIVDANEVSPDARPW